MKSIKLPLGKPLSSCYLYDAYPLSILANSDHYLGWFFTNYIGVCCNLDFFEMRAHSNHYLRSPGQVKRYVFNASKYKKYKNVHYDGTCIEFFGYQQALASPYLRYQLLSHDAVLKLNIDILEIIKNSLKDGYYFYGYVDEFYLSYSENYKKYHFYHDLFIYGFDEKQKKFFIQGYDKNNIYGMYTVTYDEFVNAFYSNSFNCKINYWTDPIYFMKHNKETEYTFDNVLFFQQLKDYYDGSNISKQYELGCNLMEEKVFGMKIYDVLIKNISSVHECYTDLRITTLLQEHKKIMKMRKPFLMNSHLYDKEEVDRFCGKYEELENEFGLMKMIIMKDIIKRSYVNQDKIREKLIMAQAKEMETLHTFIQSIR